MLIIDYRGNETKVTKGDKSGNPTGKGLGEKSPSSSSLLERCTLFRKNSSKRLLKLEADQSENQEGGSSTGIDLLGASSAHSLNASFLELNCQLQKHNDADGLHFSDDEGDDDEDPLALIEGLKQAIERQSRRKTRYTKECHEMMELAQNRYQGGRVPGAVSALRRFYKIQADLHKVVSLRKQLSDNLKDLQAHVQRGGVMKVQTSLSTDSTHSSGPVQLQLLTVEVAKSMTDEELLAELELLFGAADNEEEDQA